MSTVPNPGSLRPVPRKAISEASKWGRVTEDGSVYLTAPEGEVLVGQYTIGTPADALAFYARKYDDLVVEIDVLETRLTEGKSNSSQAQQVISRVRTALEARNFIGDISALEARCTAVEELVVAIKEKEQQRKEASKARALAAREKLVQEAQQLSNSNQWKATTARFNEIVEQWKTLPRADRAREQELWKALSTARTHFDKNRRAHFHEVDAVRKEAITKKRELIAAAQAAATTTDHSAGAKKFKDLMQQWKNAPRAGKADEDKLWKRFKAVQDEFFDKLKSALDAEDEKLKVNIPAKEELVARAEALLPIEGKDLKTLKSQLREIQDAWEKVGDLPKSDRIRLDGRLKKVEDTLRKEDDKQWTRSNPEALARAAETANAFSDGLAKYQVELDRAREAGNAKKVAELENTIANLQALLGAVENTAADLSK